MTAVLASLCEGVVFAVREGDLHRDLASAKGAAEVLHADVFGYVFADSATAAAGA